jgi:ABC-2 type transport system permease protein
MRPILALALKDLRVLPRIRMAFFFTFIWPVIVAVMFGYAFSGSGDGATRAMKVAVVDNDGSEGSRAFITRLEASGHFEVAMMPRPEAESAVRRGQLAAFLAIRPGFGAGSQRLLYGPPREIEVGADPSRKAEAGMIEGLLMQAAAQDMQQMLSNPAVSTAMVDSALGDAARDPAAPRELVHFLGELKTFVGSPASQRDAAAGGGSQWQPLKIVGAPITRERSGPGNPFEITFPQGVLWGLIGCAMSFGLSLVSERTRGTFVRLSMAPLSRAQILGGKALACFVAMVVVQTLLYAMAVALFAVRPGSWSLLFLASLCATLAFCGFMMLVSTLGRTEQAASGAAWAIMMPLSMIGGGMVPQIAMPAWMSTAGTVSPVKWAIRAIEGALWRDFTLAEMLLPCGILLVFGLVCFVIGTRRLDMTTA